MASFPTLLLNPFRQTYRFLRHSAHESPVYFYSCVIGAIGPIAAMVIPPIRTQYFGWKPAERIPTTFPVPNRPRQPPTGFEDE